MWGEWISSIQDLARFFKVQLSNTSGQNFTILTSAFFCMFGALFGPKRQKKH